MSLINSIERLYDLLVEKLHPWPLLRPVESVAREMLSYFRKRFAIVGTNDALVALEKLSQAKLEAAFPQHRLPDFQRMNICSWIHRGRCTM